MKLGTKVKAKPSCLQVCYTKPIYRTGKIVYISAKWVLVQFKHFRESFYFDEVSEV